MTIQYPATSLAAARFAPFGTTIFAEMSWLAHKHNAINLSQGFPDFDGPDFIKDAAVNAINARKNQHAPTGGTHSESPSEKLRAAEGNPATKWPRRDICRDWALLPI